MSNYQSILVERQEMVLTGEPFTTQEVAAHGLVNRVVPKGEHLNEAIKLAKVVAQRSPLAVRLAKEAVLAAFETSLEEVQRLIDTNFVGVVRLMLIGRGMVERRRGVIVSMESQTAFAGGENRAVCAAGKVAVSQLTRAAAVEWGPYSARVVCLAPDAR